MHRNNQNSVLIVEDEPASLNLLASYFMAEDYVVYKASSSDKAEELFEENDIDIILMDIKIPGRSGLELTRDFRSRSNVGIILVSQKGEDIDKIVGLEIGADDYVTKPYNPRELTIRARNLIERVKRRINVEPEVFDMQKTIAFGRWRLHAAKRMLCDEFNSETRLTEGEFQLLSVLIQNKGEALNRDQLMNHMKHRDWYPTDRTIDVMIARVRKKLGDNRSNPKYISTAHGTGYIFIANILTQKNIIL
ncbi:MAG: response regulator [Piscirickettsiaceae bacterium]|jgi:DNA-binding response OmpR family regulator|nr:response regulator [Piscirickettsiaceae bacterium]